MWPNLLETADLVTFTEKIFSGKLPIFIFVRCKDQLMFLLWRNLNFLKCLVSRSSVIVIFQALILEMPWPIFQKKKKKKNLPCWNASGIKKKFHQILLQVALRKLCQNTGFLWPVFSHIKERSAKTRIPEYFTQYWLLEKKYMSEKRTSPLPKQLYSNIQRNWRRCQKSWNCHLSQLPSNIQRNWWKLRKVNLYERLTLK